MDKNSLVGKLLCKIRKEEAYFIYFTLESHEGLCSFSTLPAENGQSFRLLEICYSLSLEKQMKHLLSTLQKKLRIEVLQEETFINS